ncbi:sigma-54 dependent transcriptional regulator [bacterium]|nr:sigma-54 dependent transcriptional regulator [bacterium]
MSESSAGLILVVDDDPILAKESGLRLVRSGFDYHHCDSGESALGWLEEGNTPDAVLLDLVMPGMGGLETLKAMRAHDPELPVLVLSGQDSVRTAVETLREGAYDYLTKPVPDDHLSGSVRHAVERRRITSELSRLRQQVKESNTFDRLIGRSAPMRGIFKLTERTLNNDITVLILGESGTGKELIARTIHYSGQRSSKPFVVVNCAAIPRELVESELFGHEKGSFTGALERKIGKFELANEGTLFLDEIGELELGVQAKLLRALQEREIERVGGAKPIAVDVRLVCATQRDLDVEVKENRFREDLYYRINAYPIVMPPLRSRTGDVEILVGHMLDKHAKHLGRSDIRGITPQAMKLLVDYEWPGNVRQLENVITRAMVLCEKEVISAADLPDVIRGDVVPEASETVVEPPSEEEAFAVPSYVMESDDSGGSGEGWPRFRSADDVPSLEDVKAWAIKEAYEACDGNISLTAKKLGLGRATLYRMLEKYGLSEGEGADGDEG